MGDVKVVWHVGHLAEITGDPVLRASAAGKSGGGEVEVELSGPSSPSSEGEESSRHLGVWPSCSSVVEEVEVVDRRRRFIVVNAADKVECLVGDEGYLEVGSRIWLTKCADPRRKYILVMYSPVVRHIYNYKGSDTGLHKITWLFYDRTSQSKFHNWLFKKSSRVTQSQRFAVTAGEIAVGERNNYLN